MYMKLYQKTEIQVCLVLKGRGPGINSSQSKNVGKIQLSMQLSHLSIIFWKYMVLMIIRNSDFWHARRANLFVHNRSSFCGFRKIILGVIRKWSFETALNLEFYLCDWHFKLNLFTAVLISNTASDGDQTPPILPGGKKSRSTPAFEYIVCLFILYFSFHSRIFTRYG